MMDKNAAPDPLTDSNPQVRSTPLLPQPRQDIPVAQEL